MTTAAYTSSLEHVLAELERLDLVLRIQAWRAVRRQEPVVTAFPQSAAAHAYRALAERLWRAPDPEPQRAPQAPERLEA